MTDDAPPKVPPSSEAADKPAASRGDAQALGDALKDKKKKAKAAKARRAAAKKKEDAEDDALAGKGFAWLPGRLRFWMIELLAPEIISEGIIADEDDSLRRAQKLLSLLGWQATTIAGLCVAIILLIPVLQPIYTYYARTPAGEEKQLVDLDRPNMTNQALLSWVASSITEIMTLGFGDFDRQIKEQRERFSEEGWESFQEALDKQKLSDAFKAHQLVLTTVPTDAPVIVRQGLDMENHYVWFVEMPVIMTYMTNNSMTRRSKSVIKVTIIRVSPRENRRGIAIKAWGLE